MRWDDGDEAFNLKSIYGRGFILPRRVIFRIASISFVILLLPLWSPTAGDVELGWAQPKLPPPSIFSVTPDSGHQGQSIELAVRGENFTDVSSVSFSPATGISVISVTIRNPEELLVSIAITSGTSPGPRSVTVTNLDGQSATLEGGFFVVGEPIQLTPTYTPPPPVEEEMPTVTPTLVPESTSTFVDENEAIWTVTPMTEIPSTSIHEPTVTVTSFVSEDSVVTVVPTMLLKTTATVTAGLGIGEVTPSTDYPHGIEDPQGEALEDDFLLEDVAVVMIAISAGIGLLVLLLWLGKRKRACSSDAMEAARIILNTISVPDSSLIYVTGPVTPGAIIREDMPANAEREPVVLPLPDTGGRYYAFLIDSHPFMKFEHEVRYAWVDLDSVATEIVKASNRMTIFPTNRAPQPYRRTSAQKLNGVWFICGEGDFAGEEKEIEEGIELDEDLLIGDKKRVAKKSDCLKMALVFDGGDKNDGDDLGETMSDDADQVAKWLKKNKWSVFRLSQYWGNKGKIGYAPIKPTGKRAKRRHSYMYLDYEFEKVIKLYGTALREKKLMKDCCHEFFLYINAHGPKEGAFRIYDPSGNGDNTNHYYAGFLSAIQSSFGKNTKVSIFVDVCYSGKLIEKMKDFGYDKKFCKDLCGLTILTATDSKTTAAGGKEKFYGYYPKEDSATQDFLEGSGCIRKNYEKMKSQGGSHHPQSFHCPKNTPWCSLDKTTPRKKGTEST